MQTVNTDNIHMRKYGEQREFNRLPKLEVLKILQENLEPVCDRPYDKILDASKYTKIARDYQYKNYKLCSFADIKRLGLEDSFTVYQKQFFKDAGLTIAIFNELNGKLVSIVFRSVMEKAFMDYSAFYSLYGYDMISEDFKYGDYLVITEGLYDADAFRKIYPNTVAMLTSNITTMQAEILKTMTDKFIIAFDSDDAGESGYMKALKRLGTNIKKLPIYPGDKDLGVLEEIREKDPKGYEDRYKYYTETLDECKTSIGFFLS